MYKNLQEICANICPDLIEKSVPIIKKPAVGERQTPWKLAWRRIAHWSYKIHLENVIEFDVYEILSLLNKYKVQVWYLGQAIGPLWDFCAPISIIVEL